MRRTLMLLFASMLVIFSSLEEGGAYYFSSNGKRPILIECEDSNGNLVAFGAECVAGGTFCLANNCPKGSQKPKQ